MLSDFQKRWLWDHIKFFVILFGGFIAADGAQYLLAIYNGAPLDIQFWVQFRQVIITAVLRALLVEVFPNTFPGPRPSASLSTPPTPPDSTS